MVRPDEEARALLFRQQQARQAAARKARNQALTGSAAAAKVVRDGWKPLILARLEEWGNDDDEEQDFR